MTHTFHTLLVTTLLLTLASTVRAETFTAGPGDDVESLIGALEPGDELVLADGTYTLDGSRFSFDIAGTEAMPIVIRAADGARPHFHRPNASQNLWDIRAEHVVLRGIAFSGGSAGLRFEAARFVTIEDCEIFETADVALRMNDGGQRYEGIRILRNEIHHTNGTGEGMYLGCNGNGCQLANSLIEGNWVHHTNRDTVSQGDGIELKEGSFGNVIRDNVIHDTNYPCILTYSTAGNGAANVIERNLLWNCGDHGIQSAADAVIRNNVILGAAQSGIALQPHQSGAPSNLIVVHNTVLNDGVPLSLRGMTGAVTVANNALYSSGGTAFFTNGDTSMLTSIGNVGSGSGPGMSAGTLAADFVMATFGGVPPMNVFPRAGGALDGSGEAAHVATDDFDGVARMGVADVGAYALASDGPRWMLGEGFKDVSVTPMPMPDGGMMDRDGGTPMPGTDGGPPVGSDASTPRADGGTDGGGDEPPAGDGGCGCVTAGANAKDGAMIWLFALGLVVAIRRRR